MEYLLIPLLCILASTKVTIQSRFSKTGHSGRIQSIFFNGIIFCVGALILLPTIFDGPLNQYTLIFGCINGVMSFVFQFFYITAFGRGKMSITVIIANFNMLIPMLLSVAFFGESFGPLKIVATILVLIAVVLTVKDDPEKNGAGSDARKFDWAWLGCTLLAFFSGGIATFAQKWYSATVAGNDFQVLEFVAISYTTATILSLIMIGLFGRKEKKINLKPSRSVIISACIAGLVLGAFQCVYTYAPSVLEATVLYPVYHCASSLMLTVVGVLLFKEKCCTRQYIGIGVGVVAITMLCL